MSATDSGSPERGKEPSAAESAGESAAEKSAALRQREEGRRSTPWALRLKIPVWLALLAICVTVLIAFFMTGPSRSTARSFDETFEGSQQVRITYCITNQQAEETDRVKAKADLIEHLEELGVKNPEVVFVSPCPAGSGQGSLNGPESSPRPKLHQPATTD